MIDEIISELKKIPDFKSVEYAPDSKGIDVDEKSIPAALLMHDLSEYTESQTGTETLQQQKARHILLYMIVHARDAFDLEDKVDDVIQGFAPNEDYSPIEPVKVFTEAVRSSVYHRVMVLETRKHLTSS